MLSSYRAATIDAVVAPADPTAFFVISGSAFVTRRVRKIRCSGASLTTLAVGSVMVQKRSTAQADGTATALTRTPLDTAYPAAQTDGLVSVYTAAPTDGTLVGTLACRRIIWKSSTVVDGASFCDEEFDFDNKADDGRLGIPLHGVAQSLTASFGADPASAITLAVEVEWTEEAGP